MKVLYLLKEELSILQNKKILKVIKSITHNPWYNLALEEELFNQIKDNEIILYLWQNENTVVIGRNQNPWRECRLNDLEKDGGKLARRLSGGGAVFHDLGNLNFTFIMKDKLYDINKQLQIIIDAVNKLGIEAKFSGRNDILVNGKKFSGNAFYYDEDRCYHHGTLLVAADMMKLAKYLKVSKEKIKSKGIKSVEARVANLQEINPQVTIERLGDALVESFMETYNEDISSYIIKDENINELKNIYDKYASWKWRYGDTPNFEIEFYNRFNFGDIELKLNLKDGYIEEVVVYSDAMDSKLILDIQKSLKSIRFTKDDIITKLDTLKETYNKEIIKSIQTWINDRNF
ncbi:lipoate--protein ligase [Mycoplasmatota bacterium]|nr:lipoate--protein ligase [Mycoplasmatota bacterium]